MNGGAKAKAAVSAGADVRVTAGGAGTRSLEFGGALLIEALVQQETNVGQGKTAGAGGKG